MGLLPGEVVRAYVADEMEAAQAWATRQESELDFDEPALMLTLPLLGSPVAGTPERYVLKGSFTDYRAVPPAWWFVHPETGEDIGPPAFPAATPGTRGSSIFLAGGPTGAVICAHFNRLAYADNGGPHGDWGAQTDWLNPPASPYTRAETIPDMLARIAVEARESMGRMAHLP